MRLPTRFFVALGLLAMSQATWPQSVAGYPSKPITIEIGSAPGGAIDIFPRLFATYMERKYKLPVIAENRPGAGSMIAAGFAKKSPADGYTLVSASNLLAYESLFSEDSSLDSAVDVLPFAIFAGTGLFICVNPALPVNTLPEFVAWVKANPGKLNVANSGGRPIAALEGLRDRLGLSWVNIGYKGGAPAYMALLAGDVQMYTCDINQSSEQMKAGRVRLIGYTGPQRHPALPQVPTIAESGVGAPNFQFLVWIGLYAPNGVPEEILAKLNADVDEMSRSAEVQAQLNAMGWKPIPLSVAQIRKLSADEVQDVKALRAKGVKLR